jgi:hypothetical protein
MLVLLVFQAVLVVVEEEMAALQMEQVAQERQAQFKDLRVARQTTTAVAVVVLAQQVFMHHKMAVQV